MVPCARAEEKVIWAKEHAMDDRDAKRGVGRAEEDRASSGAGEGEHMAERGAARARARARTTRASVQPYNA